MSVDLHFTERGQGRPLIVLHGLFGSARNWQGIATRLAPRWRILTVDLRNHGQSPHAATMGYAAMAGDVLALMDRLGLETATVVGHSMGGKTAMAAALTQSARIERLVVVDIAPVRYPDRFSTLIDAMLALPLARIGTRGDADHHLQAAIADARLRAFLLQNLERGNNGWRWRIALTSIRDNIADILDFPAWPADRRYDGPVQLIRGALSTSVGAAHETALRARFPHVVVDTIDGAGHWPHSERPAAFLACLQRFVDAP
ncbi:MAG: alpha/beta fold hydrolase [Gammaproteobacteria bacterium]|nr:alpha/beta fold hydrolase [Gammaproteobacteria bacterium]